MLNRLAVWLIALNPIAKYGLTLNPVVLSWQIGLSHNHTIENFLSKSSWRKPLVKFVGVILTSAFIVTLAILVPNFDQLMSLLGALFSFIISGIFPIMCHLKLFSRDLSKGEKALNYTLIIIASFMAFTGTVRSFI
jgi:amino acid permease